MKKRSRNRSKRRSVPVPIASMGDIAFLLIIFFMVCSEISKEKQLELVPPESEHVEKTKSRIVARIAIDQAGQIYFDGRAVDTAKDVEWGVRAMLNNTVDDEQRHIQFSCDASLPRKTFEPVLKAIAEAGGIIEAVGELSR